MGIGKKIVRILLPKSLRNRLRDAIARLRKKLAEDEAPSLVGTSSGEHTVSSEEVVARRTFCGLLSGAGVECVNDGDIIASLVECVESYINAAEMPGTVDTILDLFGLDIDKCMLVDQVVYDNSGIRENIVTSANVEEFKSAPRAWSFTSVSFGFKSEDGTNHTLQILSHDQRLVLSSIPQGHDLELAALGVVQPDVVVAEMVSLTDYKIVSRVTHKR